MSKSNEEVARELGWKRCKDHPRTFHSVELLECDCWRREIPVEHQAKSCGALATPGSAGLDARRTATHQKDCSAAKCGGDFTCEGCKRVVGWCMGGGDDLGAEHCDDCYCDRLAVLEGVKRGFDTRFILNNFSKKAGWKRTPSVVAQELSAEGFLEFKRNGRFALTPRGREAVGQ